MTDSLQETKPQGVVGVLTDDRGMVWASVSDFDRSGYGGFSLAESQRVRVKDALAREFVHKACADVVLKALETYDCRRIVDKLIASQGFKQHLVEVGHDED